MSGWDTTPTEGTEIGSFHCFLQAPSQTWVCNPGATKPLSRKHWWATEVYYLNKIMQSESWKYWQIFISLFSLTLGGALAGGCWTGCQPQEVLSMIRKLLYSLFQSRLLGTKEMEDPCLKEKLGGLLQHCWCQSSGARKLTTADQLLPSTGRLTMSTHVSAREQNDLSQHYSLKHSHFWCSLLQWQKYVFSAHLLFWACEAQLCRRHFLACSGWRNTCLLLAPSAKAGI